MVRVILSLQATHTTLEALRRSELSCAVAAQVTEKRRAVARLAMRAASAKPEEGGAPFLPYRTSAVVGSWLPVGGTTLFAGIFRNNQGKDLCSHPFLTLDPSSMQEGGP